MENTLENIGFSNTNFYILYVNYFKRRRNTHIRKNIEYEIRKPQYYVTTSMEKEFEKE